MTRKARFHGGSYFKTLVYRDKIMPREMQRHDCLQVLQFLRERIRYLAYL